jgi:xanthine dehydrogenase small subunit
MDISFVLNNKKVSTLQNSSKALLDLIRQEYNLTGTKEGCREGDCGACSVLIGSYINGKMNYKCVNSCLLPIGSVNGKHVVTIEGLNFSDLSLLQKIFVEKGASQCGFCTPGFIISITEYLLGNYPYKIEDALDSLVGNLCRCTGHVSIIESLKAILNSLNDRENNEDHLHFLFRKQVIPEYFLKIPELIIQFKFENEVQVITKNSLLVSGGTDLYVQKQDEIYYTPVSFVDSSSEDENIFMIGNKFFIKASTTINQILNSDIIKTIIPEIKNYLKLFGSNQIRNRATVGGNIVNASPIGDFTSILLALNSDVHLIKEDSERVIPLKKFYLAYKTLDLSDDEIVDKISFNIPQKKFLFNYEKVSKREHLDIASVNSSALMIVENDFIEQIFVSAGGVAPIPLFLNNFCDFMTGKHFSNELLNKALDLVNEEISPISDVRGFADYKRILLRQLILCHFLKYFPDKIEMEILL